MVCFRNLQVVLAIFSAQVIFSDIFHVFWWFECPWHFPKTGILLRQTVKMRHFDGSRLRPRKWALALNIILQFELVLGQDGVRSLGHVLHGPRSFIFPIRVRQLLELLGLRIDNESFGQVILCSFIFVLSVMGGFWGMLPLFRPWSIVLPLLGTNAVWIVFWCRQSLFKGRVLAHVVTVYLNLPLMLWHFRRLIFKIGLAIFSHLWNLPLSRSGASSCAFWVVFETIWSN